MKLAFNLIYHPNFREEMVCEAFGATISFDPEITNKDGRIVSNTFDIKSKPLFYCHYHIGGKYRWLRIRELKILDFRILPNFLLADE